MGKQQTKQAFDLIIIGGGSAGIQAALSARQNGLAVAIFEDNTFGGDSLNYSDLPLSFIRQAAKNYYQIQHQSDFYGLHNRFASFNYPKINSTAKYIVRNAYINNKEFCQSQGIQIINQRAYFLSPNQISAGGQRYTAKHFLITTGASWQPPKFSGLSEINYYTPRDFLEIDNLPKSIFIVGGHQIALVLAQLLAIFGVKVYFCSKNSDLLPNFDNEISQFIEKTLANDFDINISTSSRLAEISQSRLTKNLTFIHAGIERQLQTDELLIAESLSPNLDLGLSNAVVNYTDVGISVNQYLQTTNQRIFAAGDILSTSKLDHSATIEAETAIRNLTKHRMRSVNYNGLMETIPLIYPAIKIGQSEADCHQNNIKFQSTTALFSELPRQIIAPPVKGILKLIINSQQQLIGAQVFGPESEAIAQQLALAIRNHFTVNQLLELPQTYLSWQEIINTAVNKFN
ncbi:MAG: FAD-dependent oxidoreductase [Candidatus Saccharibacteria bacterium]|nr:FAD-dependent oxidoreductase [Candidatus Saccharibacteria bacterium]